VGGETLYSLKKSLMRGELTQGAGNICEALLAGAEVNFCGHLIQDPEASLQALNGGTGGRIF